MRAYGADGRAAYLVVELTADVVYPIAYALLLGSAIAYFARSARPESTVARYAALLPFAALAADYLENAGIVVMLSRYPQRLDALVQATSAVTCVKWALFLTAVALTLAGMAALGIARVRGRVAS